MAAVVRNADNTFTVTPTATEARVIVRWGQESGVPPAQIVKQILDGQIDARLSDYRREDGRPMREKYEALTPAKQAQVDALLDG